MTDVTREECIEKYIKMVYRIAFHYFGNREDAEDVTQDVFLKIFSSNESRENDEEFNVNTDGLEHSARSFRADLPLV